MEEMSFTIPFGNSGEVKCDVLSVVNDDQNNTYLIYTDYTLNDNNEYNVYVSQVINEGEEYRLEEIVDFNLIPDLQKVYEETVKELSLKVGN